LKVVLDNMFCSVFHSVPFLWKKNPANEERQLLKHVKK
jgi:hypothetical protein